MFHILLFMSWARGSPWEELASLTAARCSPSIMQRPALRFAVAQRACFSVSRTLVGFHSTPQPLPSPQPTLCLPHGCFLLRCLGANGLGPRRACMNNSVMGPLPTIARGGQMCHAHRTAKVASWSCGDYTSSPVMDVWPSASVRGSLACPEVFH